MEKILIICIEQDMHVKRISLYGKTRNVGLCRMQHVAVRLPVYINVMKYCKRNYCKIFKVANKIIVWNVKMMAIGGFLHILIAITH